MYFPSSSDKPPQVAGLALSVARRSLRCSEVLIWGCASLIAVTPSHSGQAAELRVQDAAPRDAKLISLDADKVCEFETSEGLQSVPLDTLISWGTPPDEQAGPIMMLNDGGQLVADLARVDRGHLDLLAPTAGNLRLPLEVVRGIVLEPSFDARTRDAQIDAILAATGETDTLVLENKDVLQGTLQGYQNEQFQLESAVGEVSIPRAKVASVILDPSLVTAPADEPRLHVGLQDSSRLVCRNLLVEGDQAQLQLLSGETFTARTEQVVFLQPIGDRVAYLETLKPASYRHVPYLATEWPYAANRSTAGGLLRSQGRLYLHGVGMHSASRLTFSLDGSMRRFAADLAIDESAGTGGSVVFRVFVGNEQRFASDVIRGGQTPVPIEVDIADAKSLSLVVDFADRGDELDHAAWLNARLLP
jgi:hypothetical protein